MRFVALMLCCAMLMAGAVQAQDAAPRLGLQATPCIKGEPKVPSLCGTFGVYEDRAAQSGRIIELAVVVLQATHPSHKAIAEIAGGPGEGTVDAAAIIADGGFAKYLTPLRDSYDIVFMDDRGMGRSYPLTCALAPPSDPSAYFKQLFPDDLVSACHDALSHTHNLALYNTNNTVDDLDDLRAALGYPKLVLDGGSYGTFFSMIYARRHPAQVESEVLDGVSPPHFQPLPGEPLGAQNAIDDLIAKCQHDAACHAAFPQFAAHFSALVRRISRGPIPVTIGTGSKAVTVQLSKEVFADHLRQLLYDPGNAAYIPYITERAFAGDTGPLGRLINLEAVGLDQGLTMGAFLSYTCSEWIPFLSEVAVKAAAAKSFTGDARIRAQQHACSLWNVPAMPASFNEPLRSDAPMLIISGTDDPATPPRYADAAVKYLPNAKIVLVRGAGHASESACTDALVVQFVRAQSAKGLDVAKCSAAFKTPKFATSMAGIP
jgi:pimeloyl-ACP methyl ester carboxylesterase